MTKRLYLGLGHLSFSLAILGIVLPVLPTTPFLLLSASAYLKGSDKAYKKLIEHPKWGMMIEDFLVNKSIDKQTLIKAFSLLWLSIIMSLFVIQYPLIKLVISMIAIMVTLYLYNLYLKKI